MKEPEYSVHPHHSLAGLDDHPFVKQLPSSRHGVLLYHHVTQGNQTWHVITRRLLEVALPEADNAWSYETAIFPERSPSQPDLTQGRYTRYGTERAAVAGHSHVIQRLMQQVAS